MKKSMVTIMFSGLILLFPKYAFTSAIFSINNLSTIESVVLYHNNSGGSGWYHCPYGTGNGLGPDKYVIPPMSTVYFNLTRVGDDIVKFYGQLPDALLPTSPIHQWQSEADLNVYIQFPSYDSVYLFHQHNIFANSGFYDALYLTNGAENLNYISSFCPTIQDANNMLNSSYGGRPCPTSSNKYTFVDPQWRLWSISCSNNDIAPVKKFREASIIVSQPTGTAHNEEIDCAYSGNNFQAIFTNTGSNVLLPADGQSGWTIQGRDVLSGLAACTESDPQQCQWAYAQESY